jgi:hypothetical protein
VFGKQQLGTTQQLFNAYLQRGYAFYDATRSTARMREVMCDAGWFNVIFTECDFDKTPVKEFWAREKPAAFTRTPSANGKGMLTFFDPSQACKALDPSDGGKQNQATVFHEALHGLTGLFDSNPFAGSITLESIFGIPLSPSSAITDYLRTNIFGVVNTPSCGQ